MTDPLLRSDLARLRGRIEVNTGSATDAHRIFVEAANAVNGVDPLRGLEMAVAAAVMQSYGADSGSRLDLEHVHAVADETPPDPVPRAAPRRDDVCRAPRLVSSRRRAGRGVRHRRSRRGSRRAGQPGQRRPAAGRRRRPPALLRPGALPGAGGRRRDVGALRAAPVVLQPAARRGLGGRPQLGRRGARPRREHRPAGAHRSPAGLAGTAGSLPGPRRLRRPPPTSSTTSSVGIRWAS